MAANWPQNTFPSVYVGLRASLRTLRSCRLVFVSVAGFCFFLKEGAAGGGAEGGGGAIQDAMCRLENLRQDVFLRGGGIQNAMCRMENLRQDVFSRGRRSES